MSRPFLTARWEDLLLLNYRCPGRLLEPLLPAGTRLDRWDGAALISLVGFMFRETRVRGLAIPLHRTFEEVNLRFYVVREMSNGEQRRGVVFIRELVPLRAIAFAARVLYHEPYVSAPMSHHLALDPRIGGTVEYRWSYAGTDSCIKAAARGVAGESREGSEAEFITEHYWGYTRLPKGRTAEYRVEHPRWKVWKAESASFSGAAKSLYGAGFAEILTERPRSAFLTVRSKVAVYPGSPIRQAPARERAERGRSGKSERGERRAKVDDRGNMPRSCQSAPFLAP